MPLLAMSSELRAPLVTPELASEPEIVFPEPGFTLPESLPYRPALGNGVTPAVFFLQPTAATVRTSPNPNSCIVLYDLIFVGCAGYLAQLGCDCERLPVICEMSRCSLVGTSRSDRT